MTIRFFLDNLWRDLCGIPELTWEPLPDLERTYNNKGLRESQWSIEFEERMKSIYKKNYLEPHYFETIDWFLIHAKNRMVQGAFRYGIVGTKESMGYNHLSSIGKRYISFHKTKNVENLFDIYNLFMLQWLDTGRKDSKLVDNAVSCLRIFMNHLPEIKLVSIDDGVHSEKL